MKAATYCQELRDPAWETRTLMSLIENQEVAFMLKNLINVELR
jgi:hypothetical protein